MINKNKVNITNFNQRITFELCETIEEGGIHREHHKPGITTWACINFESGNDIHGDTHQLNIYTFVVRKSDALMAVKNTLGRLRWQDKTLYIHQFFQDARFPQFLFGRCFDKKCADTV